MHAKSTPDGAMHAEGMQAANTPDGMLDPQELSCVFSIGLKPASWHRLFYRHPYNRIDYGHNFGNFINIHLSKHWSLGSFSSAVDRR